MSHSHERLWTGIIFILLDTVRKGNEFQCKKNRKKTKKNTPTVTKDHSHHQLEINQTSYIIYTYIYEFGTWTYWRQYRSDPKAQIKTAMSKVRKMSINSNDVDLTSMLLITTKEPMDDIHSQPPATPIPTIYPNDFDFDFDNSLKNKSTSRSFIRPPKTLGQEHRNRSVPHSLQVWLRDWWMKLFLLFSVSFRRDYLPSGQNDTDVWFFFYLCFKKLNIHFCSSIK